MMKKMIATIASLAMLAGTCAMPVAAEETTTYALGDVNMDGKVGLVDASRILCYYAYTLTTDEPISSEEYFNLSRDEQTQLPMAELEFPNG